MRGIRSIVKVLLCFCIGLCTIVQFSASLRARRFRATSVPSPPEQRTGLTYHEAKTLKDDAYRSRNIHSSSDRHATHTWSPSQPSEAETSVDISAQRATNQGLDLLEGDLEIADSSPRGPHPSTTADSSINVSFVASVIVEVGNNHDLTSLQCEEHNATRYNHLVPTLESSSQSRRRYFFALDLHQSMHIVPRLLSSVVNVMHFVGPEHCALSIVEGRSTDGTREVLAALETHMKRLGVDYYVATSDVDPLAGGDVDRIVALAALRNQALEPLVRQRGMFHSDTIVTFINDVSLCVDDLLELIHQLVRQGAEMTCAMDWIYGGDFFYDVWIGRLMTGALFFEVPPNGSWDLARNLLSSDAESRQRLAQGQPFQVFSCWNGVAVFQAKPVMDSMVRFRSAERGECYLGEPLHFCKDLWKIGRGRIAVVPSVNVGYSDSDSEHIKTRRGSVSRWLSTERAVGDNRITWKPFPPPLIKCVPRYTEQSWVRWDQ